MAATKYRVTKVKGGTFYDPIVPKSKQSYGEADMYSMKDYGKTIPKQNFGRPSKSHLKQSKYHR